MTAHELKAIRSTLGLTQKQMAERLFMTREHYNTLEAGKNSISAKVASQVSMLAALSAP